MGYRIPVPSACGACIKERGQLKLKGTRGIYTSLAIVVPISTHWSFGEMRDAFGWSLDQFIFFGGYPGAADLIGEENRWKRYIIDSMIETTPARDIFQLCRIDKPALVRQLFHLGCSYSGQILSYTKIVGQLQDAGNTTTLAQYLELLGAMDTFA